MGKNEVSLILENGSKYDGISFGYEGNISGEVVFSTNMVGYTESLTDPSFCDQILCLTYPLIGNYGVPSLDEEDENGLLTNMESDRIWIKALIVSDYSNVYSHYQAKHSLSEWLIKYNIPAIEGIDTRKLAKEIRTQGSLKGKIVFKNSEDIDFININEVNLVEKVSRKEPSHFRFR